MQHVAIMRRAWGLTQKIASGQKTIESRWYMNRSAPWGKIHEEDTIYFKDSGAPVTLRATVANVLQFDNLNPARVRSLLQEYGQQDGLSDTDLPHAIDKRGYGAMAAWITVPSVECLKTGL